jgi:hypothetical protein
LLRGTHRPNAKGFRQKSSQRRSRRLASRRWSRSRQALGRSCQPLTPTPIETRHRARGGETNTAYTGSGEA